MRRLAAALALALAATASPLFDGPASAAPRLSISSSAGSGAVASPDGPTTLRITGKGFQSLANGFGGVYLMFGWVDDPTGGSWRPSRGGKTGSNLLYVPDSEAKDNQGHQRFIAFPGSSTKDAANGGEIAADGTISLSLVVPGPKFTAQDRSGKTTNVDCLQVQCGVITIGAHGVVNADNESFTPISFGKAKAATSAQSPEPRSTPAATASAAAQGANQPAAQPSGTAPATAAPSAAASEAPVVPATLGLSQTTVQAGRVLGFTGQGFDAGEQVVATVGAGLAGVGPLTAGRFGEVAGALTLPADMRAGSHVVTLTAAGSGKTAEANLSVLADPASLTGDTAQVEPVSDAWRWASLAAGIAAALVLLLIVSSLITGILRRKHRRAGQVRVKRARREKGASA